jgi:hypothetical protein
MHFREQPDCLDWLLLLLLLLLVMALVVLADNCVRQGKLAKMWATI